MIGIIILSIISFLFICLILLFIFLLNKQKKLVLNNFANDLNANFKSFHLSKVDWKAIPVSVDGIEEDIYFFNKAVIGTYEKSQKIINNENYNVSNLLKNNKFEIFYHYKIINLFRSKFIALNKIDFLISKKNLYLYHPLDPEILKIKEIKDLTFFWEKNFLTNKKDFLPGIGFVYQNKNYFLIFQTYNEAIKFLACFNNIFNLNL